MRPIAALKVYEGVDRKIRGLVVNNTDLMAADAVYEDGLKTSSVIRSSVEQALAALVGPARTGYDERRLQYIIAGAAAGAGIFVSLLLLPTGRKDEPEVCRMASSLAMISRREATSSVPSAWVSKRSNSALEYLDSFQGRRCDTRAPGS